jgi:methylated-DNA-[protein]-cysteine S-methyltransferase
MMFVSSYNSPLGELLIFADAIGITDLCFVDHKSRYVNFYNDCQKQDTPILLQTKFWLDDYFSEIIPTNIPPLHLHGTVFQKQVWQELLKIPYGATTTYGNLAKIIAKKNGIDKMSAQAVGGAVGRNNIVIIIPCHRVIGSNGSLTGYAEGLDKKVSLLNIEGINPKLS